MNREAERSLSMSSAGLADTVIAGDGLRSGPIQTRLSGMTTIARRLSLGPILAVMLVLSLVTFAVPVKAASDTNQAGTGVEVASFVRLTGVPAIIDLGDQAPGGIGQAPSFTATVVTNSSSGYVLSSVTSDLAGPTESVSAQLMYYDVSTQGSAEAGGGNVASASTQLVLGRSDTHSSVDGDHYVIVPQILVPFVPSATYDGSASFMASSL